MLEVLTWDWPHRQVCSDKVGSIFPGEESSGGPPYVQLGVRKAKEGALLNSEKEFSPAWEDLSYRHGQRCNGLPQKEAGEAKETSISQECSDNGHLDAPSNPMSKILPWCLLLNVMAAVGLEFTLKSKPFENSILHFG